MTITGSNGTFWLRSVDVNFNKRFVVEEDEEPKATAQELAKIAARYRRYHEEALQCFDAMVHFSEECPADPPVPYEEIIAIHLRFFPPKTAEQLAKEAEFARLVELPEVEYYAWKQDFRKSLRRPPTQKEIEERRAQQVDDVKKTLLGIRVKINELSTTGVQLSPAEIDLLPDVADFISRHASEFGTTEFPVVARAQKMLDQHRAKHMDDVRPLTPEEIQAGRAILDAQITKAEAALEPN